MRDLRDVKEKIRKMIVSGILDAPENKGDFMPIFKLFVIAMVCFVLGLVFKMEWK